MEARGHITWLPDSEKDSRAGKVPHLGALGKREILMKGEILTNSLQTLNKFLTTFVMEALKLLVENEE